jgi:hypothetical protein
MAGEPDPTEDPDVSDEPGSQGERSSERRLRWDDRTSDLLEDWHLRATAAQFGHQTRAEQTRTWSIQLGLPVVILTTLVGTSAFATFNDTTSNRAKVLVGTVSILAAVLAGIQTFLGYSQVAERHRIAATRYATLRRRIEVAITRHDASLVDSIRSEMDKIGGASPQIGTKVWEGSIGQAKQEIGDREAGQGRHVKASERTTPQPRKGHKVAPGA